MDNCGLPCNVTSYPSLPLKEKLLEVLESIDGSLEALSKLLDPETRAKTVHELVQEYEEKHGQISLDKWQNIFQSLGYLKNFHDVIEQFNKQRCCSSRVELTVASSHQANADQKAEGTGHATGHGVVSSKEPNNEETNVPPCDQDQHLLAMSEEFSNQLPVNELDKGCSDNPVTMGVTEGPVTPSIAAKVPSLKHWPSWSLPPPSPSPPQEEVKQSEDNHAGSATVSDTVADDNGYFSVQNAEFKLNVLSDDQSPSSSIFRETNQRNELVDDMPSSSTSNSIISEANQCMPDVDQSLSLSDSSVVSDTDQQLENEASVKEQVNQACDSASINPGADISSQGSDTYSARPATTGMGSSTYTCNAYMSSVVTGCLPPFPCHPPSTLHCHSPTAGHRNELLGNQLQSTGNPAESYDATENIGLLEELQKENEKLQSIALFLAEELRKVTSLRNNLQDEKCHLQHELLECRAKCTDLQQQKDEITRHLNDSEVLEAENQRLMTMTEEMHAQKQEECNRLKEHIRQADARYNDAISNMEALQRESQEETESSVSLRRQLEEVQQGHEQFRDQERRHLRMEYDRQLEEVCLAFNNAETDKVKALKLKLRQEKGKRKRMEEKNKEICKENEQLKTMVRQLKSEELRNAAAGTCSDDVDWQNCDLGEDESSNSSSSDVDTRNPTGTSSASHQSASDESGDEDEFFDALDHF